MGIVGIERLVYGTVDIDGAIRFHEDWGLHPSARTPSGADFRLEDGTSVLIRDASDASLPASLVNWTPELERSTVREVVWGVDSRSSMDAIVEEISRDRQVTLDADGVAHCRDDLGNAIAFCVTHRTPVRHDLPPANGVGQTFRLNQRNEVARRRAVNPCRFSHIVYWVPADPAAGVAFYTRRLKFRVTDQIVDGSAFLRAPLSDDHHSLFLQRRDGLAGFQHVAYEVARSDDVMLLGSHMESRGWRTNVGPIRHNIGGSFSWYIWNPAGGVSEALADIDRADDGWKVGTHDPASPDFYGHTWVARPEQKYTKPADWR